MHSPDETVDEEDVAPRQLTLIKMSGWANGRDDMFKSCRKSMWNLNMLLPHYCATLTKSREGRSGEIKEPFKE